MSIDEFAMQLSAFKNCERTGIGNCFTRSVILSDGELDYVELKRCVRPQHADLVNKTLEEVSRLRLNAVASAIVNKDFKASGSTRLEFNWNIIFGDSNLAVCRYNILYNHNLITVIMIFSLL